MNTLFDKIEALKINGNLKSTRIDMPSSLSGEVTVVDFTGAIRMLQVLYNPGALAGVPATDYPTIQIDSLTITPANIYGQGMTSIGKLSLQLSSGIIGWFTVPANLNASDAFVNGNTFAFFVNERFNIKYSNFVGGFGGTRSFYFLYEDFGTGTLSPSNTTLQADSAWRYFKNAENISFSDIVKYSITREYYYDTGGFYYVSMPYQDITDDWTEVTADEFKQYAPVDD